MCLVRPIMATSSPQVAAGLCLGSTGAQGPLSPECVLSCYEPPMDGLALQSQQPCHSQPPLPDMRLAGHWPSLEKSTSGGC